MKNTNNTKQMTDSLQRHLQLKEELVSLKQSLYEQYQLPIISIQANYPGEQKLNGWSAYTVLTFAKQIESHFTILKKQLIFNELGPLVLMIISEDPLALKHFTILLETTHPLGRCVDIDVFEKDRPLSRMDYDIQERPCLICDQIARECIITRKHSLQEVTQAFHTLLLSSLQSIEESIRFALLCECMLTPKFGLVTPLTQGSHHDMDIYTFIQSIDAIVPYFKKVDNIDTSQSIESIFQELRRLGQDIEKVMFETTHGINTHKGAIFLFLMILMAQRLPYSLTQAIKLLAQPLNDDFKSMSKINPLTEGERQYHQYQTLGVRGWVLNGGEPLLSQALNYYTSKPDSHHHQVNTLLLIMSECEDSTIIKRSGIQGLKEFQKKALEAFENPQLWLSFESYCLESKLSAGGAADIFALVLYLSHSQERSLL
jgi:holo-ACP synthase / triphosphoribosyl-dephospho-CoA synthase